MSGKESREKEVKITLRELIIYMVFLICLLISAFGMADPTMYFFTKVMSNLFLDSEFTVDGKLVTFKTSTQMGDFWQYAETVMADGLYWDHWYKRSDPVTETKDDEKMVMYENLVLGVPRIRQVRVRNQSCVVHDEFKRSFTYCYDVYSSNTEDKEPFGGPDVQGTAWYYTSQEELNGTSLTVYGDKDITYGGGGYYIDLTHDYEESVAIIKNLKNNLWIDRGTRAVFVDFTVYNANVNLFCIVKLILEVPPTGGVIPSYSFRAMKLLRIHYIWDYFVLGVEVVFVIFILFYTLEEVREIIYFKCKYFKAVWNWLDLIILAISYTCIVCTIVRYTEVAAKLDAMSPDQTYHEDFTFIGDFQTWLNGGIAIVVFLSWLKIFKYISFNRTLSQLNNTLSRCAGDVLGFGVMFFIVFCAFAQLGYLLFGTQVAAFRSFKDSVFSLLRTILGDFDYEAIEKANRVLGPMFFLSYIFFVFFVLLNMFLAIINDTYSEVKSEISKEKQFEAFDFLARGYYNILNMCGCKRKPKAKDEESLSQDEIRALLKKSNFSDNEIEMFFAKYGIDKTKVVSKEESMKMLRDLESKEKAGEPSKAAASPASVAAAPAATQKEYQALESRIQQIEAHIDEITEKVDLILSVLAERKKAGKIIP